MPSPSINVGCQAYTFRLFTAAEAIARTAQAGGVTIEFFPGQKLRPGSDDILDANLGADKIAWLKEECQKHQVRPTGFGVTGFSRGATSNRKTFEFARVLGLDFISCEPSADALDDVEALVKEFDIKIAIHNHPRNPDRPDYRFWDPKYVLSLLQNRDPRMGACADLGHWVRSGIKPVDGLQILRGRIHDSHLKELSAFTRDAHDVPFGQGNGFVPTAFEEFLRQGFSGSLSIEYEHNWETNVVDVANCIGFARGWKLARRIR